MAAGDSRRRSLESKEQAEKKEESSGQKVHPAVAATVGDPPEKRRPEVHPHVKQGKVEAQGQSFVLPAQDEIFFPEGFSGNHASGRGSLLASFHSRE